MFSPQSIVERRRVAPDALATEANLFAPAVYDDPGAKLASQEIDGAAERRTGMLDVALAPEEREKRIPPMKSVRRRNAQIREQRQAFRLRHDRTELGAIGVPELEGAERLQPDHTARR